MDVTLTAKQIQEHLFKSDTPKLDINNIIISALNGSVPKLTHDEASIVAYEAANASIILSKHNINDMSMVIVYLGLFAFDVWGSRGTHGHNERAVAFSLARSAMHVKDLRACETLRIFADDRLAETVEQLEYSVLVMVVDLIHAQLAFEISKQRPPGSLDPVHSLVGSSERVLGSLLSQELKRTAESTGRMIEEIRSRIDV